MAKIFGSLSINLEDIEAFLEKLRSFQEILKSDWKSVLTQWQNLQDCWKDSQYERFEPFFEELCSTYEQCEKECEEYIHFLDKIAEDIVSDYINNSAEDRRILNNNLLKAYNRPKIDFKGYEAHHIIPIEVVKKNNPLLRKAIRYKIFEVNSAENGIFLPKTAAKRNNEEEFMAIHSGRHPSYSNAIGDYLGAQWEYLENNDRTNDKFEIEEIIKNCIYTARTNLTQGVFDGKGFYDAIKLSKLQINKRKR